MGCKVRGLGESLGKHFRQLCQARIQGLGVGHACMPSRSLHSRIHLEISTSLIIEQCLQEKLGASQYLQGHCIRVSCCSSLHGAKRHPASATDRYVTASLSFSPHGIMHAFHDIYRIPTSPSSPLPQGSENTPRAFFRHLTLPLLGLLRFVLSLHSSQYHFAAAISGRVSFPQGEHSPFLFGAFVSPTQLKWNHSRGHDSSSQPTISP